jgi:hypothetical protein
MQTNFVIAMEINFHPGDEVPVFFHGQVVGRVLKVRAAYILDDQEHTEVTVEIIDDVMVQAMQQHLETQGPTLQIFFPRRPNDIDHIFKVADA